MKFSLKLLKIIIKTLLILTNGPDIQLHHPYYVKVSCACCGLLYDCSDSPAMYQYIFCRNAIWTIF